MTKKEFNTAPKKGGLTPMERKAVASGEVQINENVLEEGPNLVGDGPVAQKLGKGEIVDMSDLMEELAHSPNDPEPEVEEKTEEEEVAEQMMAPYETKEETRYCPRCGWDIHQSTPDVSDEDKTSFVRYVLGAQDFRKSYKLFGGNIKLVFRTRASLDQDLIQKQIQIDGDAGRANNFAAESYLRQRYNAALSFVEMIRYEDNVAKPIQNYDIHELMNDQDKVKELRKMLNDRGMKEHISEKDTLVRILHGTLVLVLPPPVYSAMFQVSLDFERLVDLLLSRSTDPDFWQPTGD